MRRWLMALAFVFGGCGGDDQGAVPMVTSCMPRPDDSTGYLESICEYIIDQVGTYEIDPNTIEVREIVPGDQNELAVPPYDTVEYDWVYLDCCYTGDVAVIERASGVVVDFHLGDV